MVVVGCFCGVLDWLGGRLQVGYAVLLVGGFAILGTAVYAVYAISSLDTEVSLRHGTQNCMGFRRAAVYSPIASEEDDARWRRQGTTERAESDAAVRDEGERTCYHIATSTEHLTISSANP